MDSVAEGGDATGALILDGDKLPTGGGGGTLTGGLGGAAGGRADRVKLKSFKLGLYPITDSHHSCRSIELSHLQHPRNGLPSELLSGSRLIPMAKEKLATN